MTATFSITEQPAGAAQANPNRRVLVFSWEENSFKWIEPFCRSDAEEQTVCILSCLLVDDGGMGYEHSISWLTTGLEMVRHVKEKQADYLDWSRETWGAELRSDSVKVYSLYVESFYEVLRLDQFEEILAAWRDFLAAGPSRGASPVVLELEILESRSTRPPAGA